MRTSLVAVTALTGSLLLPFLMLGSAQAVTSAPDLKKVMSTTHVGTVMPVRAGGGGGFVGGGMVAGRGFNNGHFNSRHFVNDRHFHNRRFVNNRFFVAGGP